MKYAFILRKPVLLLFPAFILMIIWISKDPVKPRAFYTSGVAEARLSDTLPQLTQSIAIQQLQGFRYIKESGTVYYFEYETDHERLLKEITRLTFSLDSVRVDLQLREASVEAQHHLQALLQDKTIRNYFTVPNDDFRTLEYIKGDQHHYLLLSKNSERVIHLVEKA